MNKNWTAENIENFSSRIRFDFITQLEKKMESIPLTQVELAKKLGVTEGSVSQILNNPNNLTLKTIVKYACALGLKVSIVAYDDNDADNNRGLVNSEIFSICWEREGKPSDFFALEEAMEAFYNNIVSSDAFATKAVVNPVIDKNNTYLLKGVPSLPRLSDPGMQNNRKANLTVAT